MADEKRVQKQDESTEIAVEHPNPVTIVDQPVLDGLDNAVENSEVRRVQFEK